MKVPMTGSRPLLVIGANGRCQRRHGADVHYLDKSCRRALKRDLGTKKYARIEDKLNVYVVADDKVITVAHRTKRIKH